MTDPQYRPGDVANGRRLTVQPDGTMVWLPVNAVPSSSIERNVPDPVLPRRAGRLGLAAIGAIVSTIVAVVCLVAVSWLFFRDWRVELQPEHFVSDEDQGSGIALLSGAEDVTGTTCKAEFACVSAWGSDRMVLMKFASKEDAAAAARSLGSAAYRSDWLVANFTDESVSETERRYAAEALDGTWQSSVD